ncbi:ATP-grasp domain-containing protein [Candidatus Bathyarchaeota archaeon]|nr:MAG: ATP-grasp domain-containing protein [Candidatus Bathyarchaeota archaeon]
MKILVYEHASGGGFAGKDISHRLLSEGFAMLRCLVEDFKVAGHEVTVLLDGRLSKLNPPLDADLIVPIFCCNELEKFLISTAKVNDAIYIIAPETGQTLRSFVEIVEKIGKSSLNCESCAIGKAADKTILFDVLQKFGVSPKTVILSLDDDLVKIDGRIKKELGYPLVVKPVDGVGCSGLSLVTEEIHLAGALSKICAESMSKRFIALEFIRGEAASVSLLSTGKKAKALSLNKQNVNLAVPDAVSSYEGGAVPFEHWLKQEAFRIAEKVTEAFSDLKGYVGVDFVFTEHKPFVVDLNPRLTTSYVGLRKVARFNVAEALVNAVLKDTLPTNLENGGFACFSKVDTSSPTLEAFQKVAKFCAVVSPPFPLIENDKSTSLLIGEGVTMNDAEIHLEEAKKCLHYIIT